ncbi:hypothetical protein [Deinococcus peraridilitoris]|uniref:Uncharacterized protein n=1 Tax=Deinococcus peraridilitoris (strain DSM 19664 / LMG 22246 / CIP 109416 / KR-200) TaxID=937777 RepID=L0A2E6_DEIPD|nr:hypothetical protein [Deinococcus peraridilitoris]AFZ67599.1 hypothetical protein Deipe_2104 [Deinococcus peraridilitoris DSM 19664]
MTTLHLPRPITATSAALLRALALLIFALCLLPACHGLLHARPMPRTSTGRFQTTRLPSEAIVAGALLMGGAVVVSEVLDRLPPLKFDPFAAF